MKKGKLMTVVLASILAMSIGLSGCKSSQKGAETKENTPTPTAAAEWKLGDSPLEFSFYVNYDWYAPKGYGSTQATKWLQEKMKVNVKEIGSNGNAEQKFGTMVAGNDLPDVIQMDRDSKFDSLIKAGKLVALDDYINNPKYPNLKKLVSEESSKLIKRDGKTYGILNWFWNEKAPNENNKGWIVNSKIYNELGRPSLATYDDLYAYLKMVKAKYPNIVPIDTANTDGGVLQIQNMLYVGSGENKNISWTKSDGTFAVSDYNNKKFTSIFDDPGFKETYLLSSKLFREKLLSQDAFTQKLDQFKEKVNSGKVAVIGCYDVTVVGNTANQLLKDGGYEYIPYIVKPGVNVDNVVIEAIGDIGWNVNCITTAAKEPEKIFAFFDWMLSDDGIRFLQYGPKGELWDELDANGAPIPNEKFKNMSSEELAALKIGDWLPQGSWKVSVINNARNQQQPDKITWQDKAEIFYGKWVKVIGNTLNGTENYPANSEEQAAWTNIKQINTQYVSKVIFAKNDNEVNSLMSAWQKAVYDAGYQKLLDYKTKVWQENLKAIGQ